MENKFKKIDMMLYILQVGDIFDKADKYVLIQLH